MAGQVEPGPALTGADIQQPPAGAEVEEVDEFVDLGEGRVAVGPVVAAQGEQLDLVADKQGALREVFRLLRPGGALAFADIAVGRAVPDEAVCNIDLWTDCIAGGQSLDAWRRLLRDAGFVDLEVGPAIDTFGGARGEKNARAFDVVAHAFLVLKPA